MELIHGGILYSFKIPSPSMKHKKPELTKNCLAFMIGRFNLFTLIWLDGIFLLSNQRLHIDIDQRFLTSIFSLST